MQRDVKILLGLVILVLAAYGTSLTNDWVHDDTLFIEKDPRIRSLDEAGRLFVEPRWAFEEKDRADIHMYYRPLEALPYFVSSLLFDSEPWPGHLMSLGFHSINTVLVFLVVRLLFTFSIRHRAPPVGRDVDPTMLAAALAALWAVHPGNSEAVLWTASFSALGATACTLAIILLHIRSNSAHVFGRWATASMIGALYLVALLFKESGILAPALMLSFDLFVRRNRPAPFPEPEADAGEIPEPATRSQGAAIAPQTDSGVRPTDPLSLVGFRNLWPHYAVLVPVLLIYTRLRVIALGAFLPGSEVQTLTRVEQITNAIAEIPRYAALFVWPFRLHFFHDFVPIETLHDPWFVAGIAFLALSVGMALRGLMSPPKLIVLGLAWFLIGIAPHTVPRLPGSTLFADRYLYLPSIGAFVMVGAIIVSTRWSSESLSTNDSSLSRLAAGLATALIVIFLVSDNLRARDFRDEVTLFRKTIATTEGANPIRNNLVVRLIREESWDEALVIAEDLVQRSPSVEEGWHNLGLIRQMKGDEKGAAEAYQRAVSIDPSHEESLLNLGYVLDEEGFRYEAVQAYLRLTEVNQNATDAFWNLASIAFEEGQWSNARWAATRVLELSPDDRAAAHLIDQLRLRKESESRTPASGTMQRCEQARQTFEKSRPAEAVIGLRAAAWLDEMSPLPHQYLANIFSLTGKPDEALRHQKAALARDPDNEIYRRNVDTLERSLRARSADGS